MLDLRRNKIFFASLIVSVILHVSFIFALSGVPVFHFLNPGIFKVMLISLGEEKKLNDTPGKSTDYNLLKRVSAKHDASEKRRADNSRDIRDSKSSHDEVEKSKSGDQQIISDRSTSQGEVIQTSEQAQQKEVDLNKGPFTKAPAEQEGNNIAYTKSVEPSYKKETIQIARTSREIFYYDISWLGIYVGEAVLEAVDTEGLLRITSQVHSAPVISAFYKVEDFAESILSDGIPVNFRIKQHEGKYRSDKETIFDMHHKLITFFNYLKGTKDEHALKDGINWDVISGFYYLRTQTLEVGKPLYINIFDSNKFYKAKIDVLKKEKIKVANSGELNTIMVKPTLESEGLFQRRGDILIWLTDDEKRIPVRVSTKVQVGSVVAELKNIETVKGKNQ